MIGNHVLWAGDRKGCDGCAAGQCFELHDAKGVGERRKHEDVRCRQVRGEILALLLAEKCDAAIFMRERRLLRSVANHDFRARQVERQECFEILFNRDTAHGHEDRPRQIEPGGRIRIEQLGIDAAGPEAELLEAACAKFLAQRGGRNHDGGRSVVKAPQHGIAET